MKQEITLSEVDALIKKHISNKGLDGHISDEKIEEIKKKIKAKLAMPSGGIFYMNPQVNGQDLSLDGDGGGLDMGGGMEEASVPGQEEDETINVQASPEPPVSHETVVDNNAMQYAKKEGELEHKEKELTSKEIELDAKEQELAYKPQLPSSIEQAEPGKLFVYDQNQLSYGGEGLTNIKYNCMENPEGKKSMHDLWIEGGKIRAELFKVEYKKIGEMVFDPFNGTTKFVEMTQPTEDDLPQEEVDGVQQAIDSQYPTEPMIDATEPVTDVTLPPSTDMGLEGADIQKTMETVIEKILRNYFTQRSI